MIEVVAFPAPVLQPRDKVTIPVGALWLQNLRERVETQGGAGARLCCGRCCNLSAGFRPKDMLSSHERRLRP